jgi:hypothetical protein
MSKKSVDLAAKKQAKQKKIAIVGFVILIAVMAFTGPKTLKSLKGAEAVPPPPAAVTPAPGATTTPTDPTGVGAAVPVVSAELVDSGVQVEAGEGQLVSFERFASKDPFAQQVDGLADAPPAEGTAPNPVPGSETGAPSKATKPASPGSPGSPGSPSAPAPKPVAPPKPAPVANPTSAVIAVNGVNETVKAGAPFPEADQVFELVSLTATEVKVGIAGGTLTGGSPTVTLKKGKKVTLMNTADGTRYELVLVSLS